MIIHYLSLFCKGAPRSQQPFVKARRGAWAAPLVLGLAAGPMWGCSDTNKPAGSTEPATTGSGSGVAAMSSASGGTGAGAATGSMGEPSGATGGSGDSTGGSGGSTGDSPDAASSTPDATNGATGTDSATGTDTGPGLSGDGSFTNPADSVVWQVDNLQSIGGAGHAPYPIKLVGAPTVIDTPAGKAVQFGGVKDALFVTDQPVNGLKQWTAEVIFRPDIGGAQAQRWFHMQGPGGDRVLFEMRTVAANNTWFLVSFVQGGGTGRLYAVAFPHPLGQWYHVAIVIDGKTMKHFVNGVYEPAGPCPITEGCTPAMVKMLAAPFPLNYAGIGPGGTSIGCRYSLAAFLKGAVRLARFTPRALTPAEFVPVPLN
jgi:Concanavalin A-like lectin/glucanases superfamily